MGMNSRRIKDRAIEFEEEYDEAKADQFRTELTDEMKGMEVTEMDIDFFQGFIDSFTFQDVSDWCFTQVDNELADIGDQQYQAHKERDL